MKKLFSMIALAMMFMPSMASAATFVGDDTVQISAGETIAGNYYGAGTMVTMNGTIDGDAFLGASNLTVSGPIQEDAFLAASNLNITGPIADDVYGAASVLNLNSTVGGEAMLAAGVLTLLPDSSVAGEAYLAGGQVDVSGTLNGNTKIAGGEVVISGTVNGDLSIEAEQVRFTETAFVSGVVTYSALQEASVADGASIAAIEFTQIERVNKKAQGADMAGEFLAGLFGFFFIAKFLTFIVTVMVLALVMKGFVKEAVTAGHKKFGKYFLTGLVMMIVLPIVVLILLVSILGSGVGTIVGLGASAYMVLGKAMGAVLLGSLLWSLFQKGKKKTIVTDWRPALLGAVLFGLLTFIPVLGWVAKWVFATTGFGLMGMLFVNHIWSKQK